MARTNTLKLTRDGLVVNADVRTEKLDGQTIESQIGRAHV